MDILNPDISRINNDILMMQRNNDMNISHAHNYYLIEYIVCAIVLILLFILR